MKLTRLLVGLGFLATTLLSFSVFANESVGQQNSDAHIKYGNEEINLTDISGRISADKPTVRKEFHPHYAKDRTVVRMMFMLRNKSKIQHDGKEKSVINSGIKFIADIPVENGVLDINNPTLTDIKFIKQNGSNLGDKVIINTVDNIQFKLNKLIFPDVNTAFDEEKRKFKNQGYLDIEFKGLINGELVEAKGRGVFNSFSYASKPHHFDLFTTNDEIINKVN